VRDADGYDPFLGFLKLAPVFDDDVLPQRPLTLLQQGAGRDVDVLTGTTADEGNFWVWATPLRFAPKPVIRRSLQRVSPDGTGLLDAYARRFPAQNSREIWATLLSDVAFRWLSRQFAEARRGRSHVYVFDWRSTALVPRPILRTSDALSPYGKRRIG
jgi:para-nitrobenzyl esterase